MGLRLAYKHPILEIGWSPQQMPTNCRIQIVFVLAFVISFVSWLLKNKS
jgi:hypothetical protein